MRVQHFASAELSAHALADRLGELVASRPELVLGLPTGRTMVQLYAELARRFREGRLDLSRARGFNLDELLLPKGHPASFRAFMEEHAWERIGLPRERCDIPRAEADPEAECRRYEAAVREAGGLDVAILGVGTDGHVAYNLPGAVVAETHVVELPEALADSLGVPPEQRPLRAITVGLGALRAAPTVLLLATGATKRRAVQALLEGPADPAWPCSLLRGHPGLEVFVDREAAGLRP